MVAKTARFLAPIALVAVAFGVYLVVHSTLQHHSTVVPRSSSQIVTPRRQSHRARRPPKYYVVKRGDTLSAIAIRTGVTQSRLMTLNPALSGSPNNLQTGQRLRLRH